MSKTIFVAYDTTTEWQGPARERVEVARIDAQRHNNSCARQGGYGRAIVARVVGGRLQTLEGETIWPPHGHSCGAARYQQH